MDSVDLDRSSPTTRVRGRRLGTVLLVTFLSACSGGGGESTETVAGTFTLMDPIREKPGGSCVGEGGYDDVQEGLQVVIRDGGGAALATGRLGSGEKIDLEAALGSPEDDEVREAQPPDEDAGSGAASNVERIMAEQAARADARRIADRRVSFCMFTFEVPSVPKSDFYEVTVGDRGDQLYSRDEMESMGWRLDLTLGG